MELNSSVNTVRRANAAGPQINLAEMNLMLVCLKKKKGRGLSSKLQKDKLKKKRQIQDKSKINKFVGET